MHQEQRSGVRYESARTQTHLSQNGYVEEAQEEEEEEEEEDEEEVRGACSI